MRKQDYPPDEPCLAHKKGEEHPCRNPRRICERHCSSDLTTRPGEHCPNAPMPNGRCRMHGGKTPRGEALPQTKHLRYSKSIPRRLAARYEEAEDDPDRHDLRSEISLAETMLDDALAGMEDGESERMWLTLRRLEENLRTSSARDEKARARILGEILDLIRRGGQDAWAKADVDKWTKAKARLVEADVRVAVQKGQVLYIEQHFAILGRVLDIVRRYVDDEEARTRLADEFDRIGEETQRGSDVVVPIERAKRRA